MNQESPKFITEKPKTNELPDNIFSAYLAGNSLYPQTNVGVTAMVAAELTQGLDTYGLDLFAQSHLSDSQIESAKKLMTSAHKGNGVTVARAINADTFHETWHRVKVAVLDQILEAAKGLELVSISEFPPNPYFFIPYKPGEPSSFDDFTINILTQIQEIVKRYPELANGLLEVFGRHKKKLLDKTGLENARNYRESLSKAEPDMRSSVRASANNSIHDRLENIIVEVRELSGQRARAY